MRRIRHFVILAASLALLTIPSRAEAQLAISASCYPGSLFPCSFDLTQAATFRPIELAYLEVDLLGGWTFGSPGGFAMDLFGPYDFAAGFGASASTLVVDFLRPYYGPASCFPYDPLTCDILGFAVGSEFTPPTYVDLDVTIPGGEGGTPEFAWRATDIDGTIYASPPRVAVPEPSSYLLLVSGLLGLGVAWRRREAAGSER